MLKSDEVCWKPRHAQDAASKSWGSSNGSFAVLWSHSQDRWRGILNGLGKAGIPPPRGKIIEFGSGMGLLDDLLKDAETITMLDHTDAYLAHRPHPLSARCRHVLWSRKSVDALLAEPADYDWLVAIAVFYHIDDATAAALILKLGQVLRPGGSVLIQGFNLATADWVREEASNNRLFRQYPTYALNVDLLRDALAPDYDEVLRGGILVYRKNADIRRDGEISGVT
jgi:2-polyprenyl-3-methyl-5-hydroxy-6-metoxy-1,4-benzoquinol methylase